MTTTATRQIEPVGLAVPLSPALIDQLKAELERRRMLRAPDLMAHQSLVDLNGHPFNDLTKAARYKIFHGGRGSAKSWAFAEALIKRARLHPLRILCTREYQNSIADSVHKLLCDTIERLGQESWFDITKASITSKAGAEFIFKGLHNNVKEIKSTEGIDICWPEEAQTITQESWDVLLPTIRKEGSEFWISFNAENDEDPTYKMFVTNPPAGAIVHHINYDQNPYLSKVLEDLRQHYLLRISQADNDTERAQAQSDYDHVWLGETRKISNEIIFSGKYVVEEFPDDLWKKAPRLLFGADFGFSQDPSTLSRNFIYEGCLYIEFEAYGIGVELNEMDQFYKSVPDSDKWPIKGDNSRPETISHIRGFGFNCQAADKWPGSVEDGIAHMRGFKKIIIHPRCKNTIHEMKMYRYKKDRITGEVLPIIIDKHNHMIDSIRYSLDGYIQRRGDLGIWTKLGKQS